MGVGEESGGDVGKVTKISWCDHTFNPWKICTPVGPGCENCYAAALSKRWGWGEYKQGIPRQRTSAANWKQPLAWNRQAEKDGLPHRTFCASLADVFDNEVPDAWRSDLWMLISETPNLQWLLVTKRIGNVAKMMHPSLFKNLPNVRLLITVCNQDEADRDIPKLLSLPCKNGISYEPALDDVDFRAWFPWKTRAYEGNPSIQWVIMGGESGPRARPFVIGWARSTADQCRAAGVPFFMKQFGNNAVNREGVSHPFKDRAGADPAEWPEDLRIREFPA